MTNTIELKYKGVELDIKYDIDPADPSVGYGGQMDINEIYISGIDAYKLLEDQIENIYDALWDKLKELENDRY